VFRRRRARPELTRSQALGLTPVKSPGLREERLASGMVRLTYTLAVKPWTAALMRRLSRQEPAAMTGRLDLDEMGTAVWDLIDGRRAVRRIAELFSETYQVHPREAEVSVTRFLRDLGRRGLVGLAEGPGTESG